VRLCGDTESVKASELITKLQARMARDGDLPVFVLAPEPPKTGQKAAPVRWVSPGSSAPFPDHPPDWDDLDKDVDRIVIVGSHKPAPIKKP
jgi:hypothetical protein